MAELSAYDDIKKGNVSSLKKLAKPLKGIRVMHINATANGGGVAELLWSEIPMEMALGIKSSWHVIDAPKDFFVATKQMHDLLQGGKGYLNKERENIYLETNREIGQHLSALISKNRPDVIVLHDPQPLSAIASIPPAIPVISRLHGDLLTPNPQILEFIRPFLLQAKLVVLSSKDYLASMPWLPKRRGAIVYPAIDPLSEKNKSMPLDAAQRILEEFSINTGKPLMTQVSRFDPWKDPLGVIKAYYIAKNKIPGLQLILAGLFLAKDDPEAIDIFNEVKKHAKGDKDIFLFADPKNIGNISNGVFINSIYTASTIVLQKSIREGFGLTMTEAMWKGKAVIAGKTTGALIQIKNKKNGILVSSSEEAARAIVYLVKNEKLRNGIGKNARESVRQRFLMPRFVADNMRLYLKIKRS